MQTTGVQAPLPPQACVATDASTSRRWAVPEFAEELRTWAADALGTRVRLKSHTQRPWATVWRVSTESGLYYAKQNCPLQSHEAALLEHLARWAPGHVVAPIAIDRDRGFLLTPDGGPALGDRDASNVDIWCRVVAQWAEVQRAVVDRVEVMQQLTRFDPLAAASLVATRIEVFGSLPRHDPRRLPPDDADRLRALLPQVHTWGEEVAALGLPMTLNHNDLHAWNVFVPAGRGDELRFFDLGDAVVAEPLSALMVPVVMLAAQLPPAEQQPAQERLRDAFLEVWSDHAPVTSMRRAIPAALQLARLMRHEAWVRVLPPMTPAERVEFGPSSAYWLASLMKPLLLADNAR
jgi:hypothetical protein